MMGARNSWIFGLLLLVVAGAFIMLTQFGPGSAGPQEDPDNTINGKDLIASSSPASGKRSNGKRNGIPELDVNDPEVNISGDMQVSSDGDGPEPMSASDDENGENSSDSDDENADSKDENKKDSEDDSNEDEEQDMDELKKNLTPEQYNICFLGGTEPPGSGEYNKHFEPGEYRCVVCEQPLFASDTKYDSGSGWPAFWDVAYEGAIDEHEDRSLGMVRTEVTCSNCEAHLGHVFNDGPQPTGVRYCINSLALEFVPEDEMDKDAEDKDTDKK